MKKLIPITLAALLIIFSITSCNNNSGNGTDVDPANSSTPEDTENSNNLETTPEENIAKFRKIAVDYMRFSSQVKWKAKENMDFSKDTGFTTQTIYDAGSTYTGVLYSPGRTGTDRFISIINEDGFYTGPTSWGGAYGTTCSTSIYAAWSQFANSFTAKSTQQMLPSSNTGILPVGDYKWSEIKTYTGDIIKASGQQTMFKAYALLKPGDAIVAAWPEDNNKGHTRMVVEDPFVLYNDDGTINANKSYITTIEQSSSWDDTVDYKTTWKVDRKYYFSELSKTFYIPVTISELATGVSETPSIEVTPVNNPRNILAGLKGKITSNYKINKVAVLITNESGQEIISKAVFPDDFTYDLSLITVIFKDFELGKYHITATVYTGILEKIIYDFDFDKV